MSVFQLKSTIRITCARYCAPYLEEELLLLGYTPENIAESGIELKGTLLDCMRLNMYLRTAYRVLFLIDSFEASNPDELYKELNSLPWDEYIPAKGYISITSHVENIHIRDTRFANLRVKDAVVDKISSKMGTRPDSGPDTSRTVLFLFWRHNEAAIYIDTSGDTIAKHAYRRMTAQAPMMESLAACVVMATGWRGHGNFINPMCGSGTIVIEAALIAINKAPGLMRSNYGFMHILGFPEAKWQEIRNEAKNAIKDPAPDLKIIATDRDFRALNAAETNAKVAGVERLVEFKAMPFERTFLPKSEGIIVINPPYGERMGANDELDNLYAHIGFWFKQKATGYTAYVFTGNPELAKRIGLKTSRKIPFFNAKIECRLLEYELYQGSRKYSKQEKPAE
jgi:putative N6-adenine-specific DNA methylase